MLALRITLLLLSVTAFGLAATAVSAHRQAQTAQPAIAGTAHAR